MICLTLGRFLRSSLLSVILAGASSTVFAAPHMPNLDDPQLQGFLDTLKAEYEQYLASGNPHLVRPSEIKPWPCQLTPAQLNKLAGTTNSDDDPIKKREFINYARSWHSEPIKVEYSNQTFYPVQAVCQTGNLEGPVEFWVEYDSTQIAPPSHITSRHELKHVRLTARQGNPAGLVLSETELLRLVTKYNDPATEEMMSKQKKYNTLSVGFDASWVSESPMSYEPSVGLSHIDLDSNGQVKLTVNTVRPFGENRHQVTHYGSFGDITHKDSTTLYKDGKQHGLQVTYPGVSGSFPVPGSQTCWEEGEKVLADPCDVN